MEQSTEIEFHVDEQYENEKGIFTVVSIQKDQMVIRWEDGQEIKTDIELQRRIAERRQWEEAQKAAEQHNAKAAKRKPASPSKASVFSGLAATDFKNSAYRTTWRSRDQLGGAVTPKIKTDAYKLNSWALGSQPEMLVQDSNHRGQSPAETQAAFFVRADPHALYYGFRVTRRTSKGDAPPDWQPFSEWLGQDENQKMLHGIAAANHVKAWDRLHPQAGVWAASDDGWAAEGGAEKPALQSLMAFVEATPEENPFQLELFATIEKDAALEAGPDLASNIAQLFTQLLPLYQAVTKP